MHHLSQRVSGFQYKINIQSLFRFKNMSCNIRGFSSTIGVLVECLGILGHQALHEGDVLLLGSLATLALLLVPGLPLGLALEVEQTGLGSVVVTHAGLLEEGVQLQELVVAGALGQGLHLLGGGVELLQEKKCGFKYGFCRSLN